MFDCLVFDKHVLIPEQRAQLFQQADVGVPVIYNGVPLRALPHDDKHTRMLWSMGLDSLPAPISVPSNFDWPGRFKPMAHQRRVAAFKATHRRCFDLSGLGSGKTASSIWAAEYLLRTGQVKKIGVVAPLSCLRTVWENEILNLTPMREAVIVHGGKAKRKKALSADASYYIINHDGVKTEVDALSKLGVDLWIIDEFTAFKTHDSDRSRAMFKLVKDMNTRLWMMSGTPTPQSPVDAYFPCRMLNPRSGLRLGRFRESTMVKVSDFTWKPRRNAQDFVRAHMQPAILIRKEDVLDLPPVTYLKRQVELTPRQIKLLRSLKEEKRVQIESGDKATAVNAAALVSKALQIAQGSLIDDDGTRHRLPCSPRLKVCRELIDAAQAKTIVFAPFTAVLHSLRDHLGEHYRIGYVDGSVSETQRSEIYRKFQTTDEVQVLVAHPKTTAHGLTLTAADLTVWYGPVSSNETFLQANQRMNRPGQTRPMTIAQMGATPEEWAVYKTLNDNTDMQETLLELYNNI